MCFIGKTSKYNTNSCVAKLTNFKYSSIIVFGMCYQSKDKLVIEFPSIDWSKSEFWKESFQFPNLINTAVFSFNSFFEI